MYRKIRRAGAGADRKTDAVAVVLFDGVSRLPAGYAELDKSLGQTLSQALKRPELSTARGQITCLYPPIGADRLYVLGLGHRDKSVVGQSLRVAAGKLVRAAHDAGVSRVRLELEPSVKTLLDPDSAGRAVGDGLCIANFQFDTHKGITAESKLTARNTNLTVAIDAPMQNALHRALIVGESMNLARDLAATPPNVANPSYLTSFCRRLSRDNGLKCTVIDAKRAAQLKMGGLLAVGAGGSSPPALICLHWNRGRAKDKPIMLVGKAVTFDTGGYSIKPTTSMDSMKYDKCGGTAVIGAMHAIAQLKPAQHVVALIPTAENMIDQKAYRPGDIVPMSNGVTVEVTNTDAEGRLLLGDALAYGCKTYKPRAIIDLATLTGGVVVALGAACAGVFCNDDKLRKLLVNAGEQTGERLWHLPMWDEYRALLKSSHADIINAGIREAHPIQGAVFLSHFVDDKIPWAHLDIAGVSDVKREGELYSKGPTGFGVRLLVRTIETWANADR